MPREVLVAAVAAWTLVGTSVLAAPGFLAMGLIEFGLLSREWRQIVAVVGSLALLALTLQTSIGISSRSRSAPRLVMVLAIAGGVTTLFGLLAFTLHVDSIVDRFDRGIIVAHGIFSGYAEAAVVLCFGLATLAAYGLIAVAVRRNAAWFRGAD